MTWGRAAVLISIAAAWLALDPPTQVHAHGLAPIAVDVREGQGQRVQVRWTLPSQGSGLGIAADGTPLQLLLPEDCERRASGASHLDARFQRTSDAFRCARPLAGRTLRVRGLAQSQQAVVLRYTGPTENEHVRTLFGVEDGFLVPGARASTEAPWSVLARYIRIGTEHILGGFDHLAFVLCLAVVASGLRALWWPVTAFTLAHSITLGLGASGTLRLPSAPVEACIALSVLWMAIQALQPEKRRRAPGGGLAASAFAFGLLHGMGFAGALRDVGLSGPQFAWSLLGFNLGVEVGQLGVIAVLAALAWLSTRLDRSGRARTWAERVAVELSGVAAGYWLVQRALDSAGLA